MAQNLQILKRRIKTAQNISQVARAMEMIAASKIKRAQTAVLAHRPYAEKIMSHTKLILENIDINDFSHPYLSQNESDKTLLILVAPDKGLCGSLITNLLKKFMENIHEDLITISIGKKMARYASRFSKQVVATFDMGTRLPHYSLVYPIINIINELYEKDEIGKVEILYPAFTSLFTQTPTREQLLPIHANVDIEKKEKLVYTLEPDIETILSSLLPHYIEVLLYNRLLEAFTSEQAARMLAMQNAKNNALDIADFLTLSYNKSRQEKITNELLDLSNSQFV